MSHNTSDIHVKIKNTLSRYSDIAFVFLFGSYARGNVTESSDADIAILFLSPPDFYKITELKQELSKALKTEVDILVLNNASVIVKMQVLKHGILLITNNDKMYNEFFVDTVKKYDDLKRTRKEIEDNILKGKMYA